VGVVIFMLSGISGSSMTGNLIALTESISFAFMTVGAKKSAGDNPLGLTALANLFTGLFIFFFLPPQFADLGTLTGMEWIIILILGVVQIGLGYALYNMGVRRVSPQKASVIALWEMILGPVWVAVFLHEYPGLLVLTGFVIIIAGILADARADGAVS
ncbi:MAG: DMT family transporter, partial [Firmicutes bacterium]|nr:DMT family transporter [Bacillota bacterium]